MLRCVRIGDEWDHAIGDEWARFACNKPALVPKKLNMLKVRSSKIVFILEYIYWIFVIYCLLVLYTVFNAATQFDLIVKLYMLIFMFNCLPYGLTKLSSYTLLLNLKARPRREGIRERKEEMDRWKSNRWDEELKMRPFNLMSIHQHIQ